MGYELTDDDIGNLFRILVGKTRTFEGDVRSWFATLPVVAAGTPEPTEPPPSEAARPGDVAATEEDAAAYGDVFDQEYHTLARAPGEYMAARVAALNVVYRRMRARERPAPSGPDPLAEPTPSPPAAEYMTYHPDRIEFRAKGDGQHDPVVATVTAEGLLAAMRAVAEKGVDA